MLTGPELGAAIEAARIKKGVTKKQLAADFSVSPPSIQDWVRRGTIDKEKLARLWVYFADVVGPEHWGLSGDAVPLLAVAAGPEATTSITTALRVIGAALATEIAENARDEIAKVCDLWVRQHGDKAYQDRLVALLERPAAAAIARAMKADPPPPMEAKRSFKPKTLPPQAGTPDPAPVAVPPRARNRSDA